MLRSLITSRLARRPIAAAAAVTALTLVAGGCETKSFLDPAQVGRFKADPVTVPILDSLNLGTDEVEAQYANARDVTAEDLVDSNVDYTVGPNDSVSVTISDLVGPGSESTKTIRVSNSGTITLPLLPHAVQATGLSEQQLEKAISDAYKDAQIIQNPNVSVAVVEARGRTYYVYGAVARQSPYAIYDADFRLLNALVTAGDVTSTVGIDYIYVSRKKPASKSAGANSTTGDMGGGGATSQPTTMPSGGVDPLAPKSDASDLMPKRSAMLQTAPSGSIVVIDGKEVTVNPPPSATNPTTAAPVDPNASNMGMPGNTKMGMDDQNPGMMPGSNGGFAFNAPAEPTDREVIRVPFDKLRNGEMKYNIIVRPGDVIYVENPVVGEYYIGGNVLAPGAFSLNARRITLKEAVTAARGFNEVSWPSRTDVIRRLPGDKEIYVRVDLDKVFSGQEPDLFLKPDDHVIVGTNAIAPFLGAIRNGFRLTYGFGFLYDRNFDSSNNNNR